MRFLADESCDAAVSRALRAAGHDVANVIDIAPRADDESVLQIAVSERRILLTEDKDFGRLVFEAGAGSAGVILIRYRFPARRRLWRAVVDLVAGRADELMEAFVVLEPERIRITQQPES